MIQTLRKSNVLSYTAFHQRISQLLELVQYSSKQKVLVVSSGGVISHVLGLLLHMPAEAIFELNLQFQNTGVSHCFFNKHAMRVASVNHLPHLHPANDKALITY